MRKFLSLILVLVLVLGSMPFTFADEHEMTAGEKLQSLGLVQGNEEGNLMEDSGLTRAEMMVMLARLNNVETEALNFDLSSSFTDAEDHWAANYIAYAEVQGWTQGVGGGLFAPQEEMTPQMVATFMLRVLGYEANWDTALIDAAVLGIMDDDPGQSFTRANAFDMMYDAVNTQMANGEMTLGQKLGVDTEPDVVAEDVTIKSAVAINENVIEVSLDEDIDAPEMVDASIFMVMDAEDDELSIESAEFAPWDLDDYTVLVTIEEDLIAGEAYSIASGDSEVDFGGMIADEDEPTVDDVTSEDYNKVKITFNEAVMIDDLTVEIAEKYGDKDDLAILDFEYDGSDTIIVTTGEQADATLYAATIDGAVDLAGNTMDEDDSQTFTGQEMDTDEQEVTSATGHDSVTVKVTFRTKVEEDAALDASNYSIAEKYGDKDEVIVASVAMEEDDEDTDVDESKIIAVLTLADHTQEATLYELEVDDVGTLYGKGMDSDNNSVTFTGKAEDTDAPDDISVTSTSNTEVVVTVTDDSDIVEDVDAGLFSIAEKYGDKDDLVVIAIKEVDTDAKQITLTTSEQSDATLYELTIDEGLADKFGNVTDDELEATFTGSGVADEIDSVTATNPAKKKVLVKFNENYGDGALSVINYKIDGGIGYPTKVEAAEAGEYGVTTTDEDKHVLLTVSDLTVGEVYELTVKNVKNSDGVAMDSDGVTDKFAGKYGSSDSAVTLEAVVATDNQTLKLYFDKAVEDITGISEGTLVGTEFDIKYEGGGTDDLDGYGYIDASNEKVLILTGDTAGIFDNDDGDEMTLIVNNGVVVDIDTDEDANEVLFAENTSAPDDIVIEGIVALDSYTLKVYFNQPVRNMNAATFAKVTDNDGNFAAFGSAYSENDEMTQWIFVMDTQMVDATDNKLDFVVIDGTESEISTHTLNNSKVEYSSDSDDETVEFSKNTKSTNYMDNIGVVMLDGQTIKVYYPENMNTTDVTTIANYDIEVNTDANDDNAFEGTITKAVWEKDDNSVVLTLSQKLNTSLTKLNLAVDNTVANKAGTKTVKDEDGSRFFTEFAVSTSDADEVGIRSVEAYNDTNDNTDKIEIVLDQPTDNTLAIGNLNAFIADFDIFVDGTKLTAGDITGLESAFTSEVSEDAVTNNVAAADTEDSTLITLEIDPTVIDTNSAVEVVISENTSTGLGLTGQFNGLTIKDEDEDVTSGTDKAIVETTAPTVVATTSLDSDGDGVVDTLEIEFSEAIKDSTVTAADWALDENSETVWDAFDGMSTEVTSLAAANVVDDKYIALTISSPTNVTTTGVMDFKYTAGGTDLTDLSDNALADIASTDVDNDEANPIVSTWSADFNANGDAKAIVLNFSEAVTTASLDLSQVSLADTIDSNSVALTLATKTQTDADTITVDALGAAMITNINTAIAENTDTTGNTSIGNVTTVDLELLYTITAFEDANANAPVAVATADNKVADSITADTTAPRIASVVSADGMADGAPITFTFDDYMPAGDIDNIANYTETTAGGGVLIALPAADNTNQIGEFEVETAAWANGDSIIIAGLTDLGSVAIDGSFDNVIFTDVANASVSGNNTID